MSDKNGGIKRLRWTRQVGYVKTAFLLAIYIAAYNLTRLLVWSAMHGDTRDPLTQIDVTTHGHYESDAHGHALVDGLPPLVE